jgi:dCMP deaminase
METRPSWQKYFSDMAVLVAQRSTCMRRKVGAVLVKDNQIIATGYNGAPKHLDHCEHVGCMRQNNSIPSGQRHELCRGVHAEQNAIIQAAINGVSVQGADLYCTNHPCSICAKMIINAEIRTVYIIDAYPDELASQLLKEGEVEIIHYNKETGVLSRV